MSITEMNSRLLVKYFERHKPFAFGVSKKRQGVSRRETSLSDATCPKIIKLGLLQEDFDFPVSTFGGYDR